MPTRTCGRERLLEAIVPGGRDSVCDRVVKSSLRPGTAGGSKQLFVIEKQDSIGATGAGGGRLGGDERQGMAARRASHGRAAFFCQLAEGSSREVREYGFIVISRERRLACSHRVAERRRALFRQLHIRERSAAVDRRPRVADDSRHQKHRRTASRRGATIIYRH
jgi:hypothetical protein